MGCCCCSSGGDVLPPCEVAGNVLVCNGTDWVAGQVDLADPDAVTGVLGVANGGTGVGAVGAAGTVLQSNGATNFYDFVDNSNVDAAAAIAVSKLAVGAANTVLTSSGVTNAFALIVNANVDAAAAIAVSKLAVGAANTVLTSSGVTNSFALIVNANVDAAAAIAVSKLAVGAANTVLTSSGATNSFALIVNANVDAAAAIAVSKLAVGAANTVLTTDGATDSFNLLVNANIAAGAAIAVTKLALGAANTVLASDGATNSFTTAPTVVSLAATTFMSIGAAPLAAAGLLRLPNAPAGGGVVFRNAANSADVIALTVSSGNVTTIAGSGGVSLTNTTTITSGNLNITSGNITWGNASAAPVISQTITTNATAVAMTISAQSTSSNGVSTGGALNENAGDATGTTGTHTGGAYSSRAGDATGAAGTRTGGNWTARPGSGASLNGSLQLRSGGNVAMVEVAEVANGRRNVSLVFGATLTTTQMPANTGDLVVFVGNAATAPTANSVGGGILYSEAGAGKWRGTGGTITTFGAADPHCPKCGNDYVFEAENQKKGHHLAICWTCFLDECTRKGINRSAFAFIDRVGKAA